MSATIRDVARRAGVSPSTVSRVLNKKNVISEETQARIYEAMKELEYVPNDIARSFASGAAHAIAIAVDVDNSRDYANNFFNNMVFGIETAAHQHDYNLIITNGAAEHKGLSALDKLIKGKKIDGIVLPVSMADQKRIDALKSLNFPFVVLGRVENSAADVSWVDINNIQAGAAATRHLLSNGYKRVAFLSDGAAKMFNGDRIQGYEQELAANGIAADPALVVHEDGNLESGTLRMRQLLAGANPPDAVICSNDRLALAALRVANASGFNVPENFGILSFDNTAVTELAEIPITCIEVDTFELGNQAALNLIQQINGQNSSAKQILLTTSIIERETTKRKGR